MQLTILLLIHEESLYFMFLATLINMEFGNFRPGDFGMKAMLWNS